MYILLQKNPNSSLKEVLCFLFYIFHVSSLKKYFLFFKTKEFLLEPPKATYKEHSFRRTVPGRTAMRLRCCRDAAGMHPRSGDPSGTVVFLRLPWSSVYTPLRGLSLKQMNAKSEKNEYLLSAYYMLR